MNTDKPGIYINIFLPSFTSMAVAFTLPFFNNLKQIKNKSFTQFITATSILSYSIYLIHWSLVIPFINNIQGNTLLLYALFWVLTYLLSIINYFYFEQKMTKLRDRF
jgi:peptidoglycan/LPS O-acetylase OafA/YrhL